MKQDDIHRYDDMLELPHHVSRNHPRMSEENRAAQFMPFAALKGYEDAIADKEIRDAEMPLLSEEDRAQLQQTLVQLLQKDRPTAQIRWYEIDENTGRGVIRDEIVTVRKVSEAARTVTAGNHVILIDNIIEMNEK